MRSPARLNVRDDLALEPGQIGVYGQHYEKEDADLDERDEDFRVLSEEVVHDLASASCNDSIMVQKRVRVPVGKRVSCAGRFSPAGNSSARVPLLAPCPRFGSS